jgi:hypothetical protein
MKEGETPAKYFVNITGASFPQMSYEYGWYYRKYVKNT